jgi:hypothetical protein
MAVGMHTLVACTLTNPCGLVGVAFMLSTFAVDFVMLAMLCFDTSALG